MIAIAVDPTKWVTIGEITNLLHTKSLQRSEYFNFYRQIKRNSPKEVYMQLLLMSVGQSISGIIRALALQIYSWRNLLFLYTDLVMLLGRLLFIAFLIGLYPCRQQTGR